MNRYDQQLGTAAKNTWNDEACKFTELQTQLKKLLQTKTRLLDQTETSLFKAQKELAALKEAKSSADKARSCMGSFVQLEISPSAASEPFQTSAL